MKATKDWEKIRWPYSDVEPYASMDCWQYRNVILYPGSWPEQGWSYVASFGPNDERSHCGSLKGFPDLMGAKAQIHHLYAIGKFE